MQNTEYTDNHSYDPPPQLPRLYWFLSFQYLSQCDHSAPEHAQRTSILAGLSSFSPSCLSLPELQKRATLLSPVELNPIDMHRTKKIDHVLVQMEETISLMNKLGCSPMFLNSRGVTAFIQNLFQSSAFEWENPNPHFFPLRGMNWLPGWRLTQDDLGEIKNLLAQAERRDHKKLNFNYLEI